MKMVRGALLMLGAAAAALVFTAGPASAHGHHDGNGGGQYSGPNVGALNGNQFWVPIDIPINVCGNSIAILGLSSGSAVCVND